MPLSSCIQTLFQCLDESSLNPFHDSLENDNSLVLFKKAVNSVGDYFGFNITPLALGVVYNNIRITRFFLEYLDANPNRFFMTHRRDYDYDPSYMWEMYPIHNVSSIDMLQLLFEYNCFLDVTDEFEGTLLHQLPLLMSRDFPDMYSFIRYNSDIRIRDTDVDGYNPLHTILSFVPHTHFNEYKVELRHTIFHVHEPQSFGYPYFDEQVIAENVKFIAGLYLVNAVNMYTQTDSFPCLDVFGIAQTIQSPRIRDAMMEFDFSQRYTRRYPDFIPLYDDDDDDVFQEDDIPEFPTIDPNNFQDDLIAVVA